MISAQAQIDRAVAGAVAALERFDFRVASQWFEVALIVVEKASPNTAAERRFLRSRDRR